VCGPIFLHRKMPVCFYMCTGLRKVKTKHNCALCNLGCRGLVGAVIATRNGLSLLRPVCFAVFVFCVNIIGHIYGNLWTLVNQKTEAQCRRTSFLRTSIPTAAYCVLSP
jgi:hypothetical protein